MGDPASGVLIDGDAPEQLSFAVSAERPEADLRVVATADDRRGIVGRVVRDDGESLAQGGSALEQVGS